MTDSILSQGEKMIMYSNNISYDKTYKTIYENAGEFIQVDQRARQP